MLDVSDTAVMAHSSNVSFREKSAWVSLGVILVVYVPYFIYVCGLGRRGELTIGAAIGIFIAAVIFQVVLAIVAHIAVSIRTRVDRKDERDSAIESKAFRNAYFVLTSAICLAAIFVTLVGLGQGAAELATAQGGGATHFVRGIGAVLSPAAATQILLLCLVVAEASKYGTQVFCYRGGR